LAKAGCTSLAAHNVKGRGKQRRIIKTISGKSISALVEIVVDEDEVKKVTDIKAKTACTDTIGDGKIFVSTIDDLRSE
jgi:nitrogen regulatory protein P-II 1